MSSSLHPMDCTVHGILQARILKWVAFPFSLGSSQFRDQTQISHIAGRFFTSWAIRELVEVTLKSDPVVRAPGGIFSSSMLTWSLTPALWMSVRNSPIAYGAKWTLGIQHCSGPHLWKAGLWTTFPRIRCQQASHLYSAMTHSSENWKREGRHWPHASSSRGGQSHWFGQMWGFAATSGFSPVIHLPACYG